LTNCDQLQWSHFRRRGFEPTFGLVYAPHTIRQDVWNRVKTSVPSKGGSLSRIWVY
jgi:hypothetical protein